MYIKEDLIHEQSPWPRNVETRDEIHQDVINERASRVMVNR